jgi:hypothetical protein
MLDVSVYSILVVDEADPSCYASAPVLHVLTPSLLSVVVLQPFTC